MSQSQKEPWIVKFCNRLTNKYFCEVDKEFILDESNLVGLKDKIPNYRGILRWILDKDKMPINSSKNLYEQNRTVEQHAELLYGLIHCRFIQTKKGIDKMIIKYNKGHFGYCPRYYCNSQRLLPVGLSDVPGKAMVKLFCQLCREAYIPPVLVDRTTDGAFFGTEFPYTLLKMYSEYQMPRPTRSFEPKLFGFKIHPTAYEFQRRCANALKPLDYSKRN